MSVLWLFDLEICGSRKIIIGFVDLSLERFIDWTNVDWTDLKMTSEVTAARPLKTHLGIATPFSEAKMNKSSSSNWLDRCWQKFHCSFIIINIHMEWIFRYIKINKFAERASSYPRSHFCWWFSNLENWSTDVCNKMRKTFLVLSVNIQ